MDIMVKTRSARHLALESLWRIEIKGEFAKKALDEALDNPLSSLDKGLIMEIVYGVLRHRRRLDWIIEGQADRDIEEIDPWVRNNLRMGTYQILFLERIPQWAAVDESVELAKFYGHTGAAGFVNGVLRNIIRNRDTIRYPSIDENPILHISILYSHPEWLVKRWVERFGIDETISLCKANNEIPPLTIRVNTLRIKREDLLSLLREEVEGAEPTSLSPYGIKIKGFTSIPELRSYRKGLFQVQDEGAQLIAPLLDPKKGERILDACAGPGGKATHMAEIMGDDGEIIALDTDEKRLDLLRENVRRLGINIIKLQKADSTKDLSYLGTFDRILVDAPCSGLGVLRRHPEGKWRKKEWIVREFQKIQLSILKNVSSLLRPEGRLVYSACSIEPEEGEEVIERFLKENIDFYLVAPSLYIYPHIHGTDGFFAATIGKA